MGLAAVTACPEWELDHAAGEDDLVAKALARIIDHYELHKIVGVATHPVAGMARVAWAIYLPRIIAIRMRKASERARPTNAAPPQSGLPKPPPTPEPPRPQAPAPPPAQAAPPQSSPPVMRSPIVPPPAHMRAAPIPGFENFTIDVPIPGATKQ